MSKLVISQAQLTSCQFSARWVTGGHLDWQASLALPKTLCDYANFFTTLFTEFFFSLSPCFSTLECLIVTVDMTVSSLLCPYWCFGNSEAKHVPDLPQMYCPILDHLHDHTKTDDPRACVYILSHEWCHCHHNFFGSVLSIKGLVLEHLQSRKSTVVCQFR